MVITVSKQFRILFGVLSAVTVMFGSAMAGGITPTPYFTSFYDSLMTSTFNGRALPVGSVVSAFDPDGVQCGAFTVHTAGTYGFMPVYGDDPNSAADEGATNSQTISFKINGRPAAVTAGSASWTDQTLRTASLAATGNIAITGIEFPDDMLGGPGHTYTLRVGVRNDGDGLDLYGMHITMDAAESDPLGWRSFAPTAVTYANVSETAYVYFQIRVATFSAVTENKVNLEVFSELDPSKAVTGSFTISMSITDVEDPTDNLPGGFAVHQNYPNPFNPSTTISFTLPTRSTATLDVFDILGRTVESRNLGELTAGDHSLEFDASQLASGVYLYRVTTEHNTETRKMMLMK